jgi:WD40 repeat protein
MQEKPKNDKPKGINSTRNLIILGLLVGALVGGLATVLWRSSNSELMPMATATAFNNDYIYGMSASYDQQRVMLYGVSTVNGQANYQNALYQINNQDGIALELLDIYPSRYPIRIVSDSPQNYRYAIPDENTVTLANAFGQDGQIFATSASANTQRFSPNGQYWLEVESGEYRLTNTSTQAINTLSYEDRLAGSFAFSQDSTLLAVTWQKPETPSLIQVWDVNNLESPLYEYQADIAPIIPFYALTFSPDNRLTLVYNDGIRIYNPSDMSTVFYPSAVSFAQQLVWSNDGHWLAVLADNQAWVWDIGGVQGDLLSAESVVSPIVFSDPSNIQITGVMFSPNNDKILVFRQIATVDVYNIASITHEQTITLDF